MGNNNTIQIHPNNSIIPELLCRNKDNKGYILGIIDIQNDFFKGGSLAVKDAEEVIAPINKLRFICYNYMETFLSQDFHPENHMSFGKTHNVDGGTKTLELEMPDGTIKNIVQDMWPVHCVEDTYGSKIHKDLIVMKNDKKIKKGTLKNIESYSAFGDEFESKYENTGLNLCLKNNGITNIIFVGIATDYCIYNTAKDAIRLGYKVHLILSCVRGVKPNTTEDALNDLKNKGVIFYDDVDNFVNLNSFLFLQN